MKQIAIGTQLSPFATKVMRLGSGELGKEVNEARVRAKLAAGKVVPAKA